MNYVKLEGNLGDDPELRYTAKGTPVANASLATRYKKDDNEFTTWHRIVAWGEDAEKLSSYAKGDKIRVEGYLQNRKWEDRNGNTRYTTEIVAYNTEMMFKKGERNAESSTGSGSDDDLPF